MVEAFVVDAELAGPLLQDIVDTAPSKVFRCALLPDN